MLATVAQMTQLAKHDESNRRWLVLWNRQLRGGWRCYRTVKGGVAIWTPFFSVTLRRLHDN